MADVDSLVTGRSHDVGGCACAGVDIADGERDRGSGGGQDACGLDADPRRAARDDRALAGEIDALHHLGRRGLEAERCSYSRDGVFHRKLLDTSKWRYPPFQQA